MKIFQYMNRTAREPRCPNCGRKTLRIKDTEVYYACTLCGQINEAIDSYLTKDTYWRFVWDNGVDDPVADEEALKILKKELEDSGYLTKMLCDKGLLEPECNYVFEVYMHDVDVFTEHGSLVGHLQRWRMDDEELEDEAEEDII